MSTSSSKLFTPLRVGTVDLQHRIVLAPLTRYKADAAHVPYTPLVPEYYAQRASTPGTLLITEATFIAPQAGGYAHVPGVWSKEQVAAWKEVTAAVHAKGSFIYMQLWALGRAASYDTLRAEDPTFPYVSASDIPLSSRPAGPLRALTVMEIKQYVEWYAQASRNAIEAGFDGVEIHSANGYLLDQFLQDLANKRTDEYGGSVENRARFVLEVVDAIVAAIGPERTAIRFSPWGQFQEMGMPDPLPQFSYTISQIAERHPSFAYLHLVEPRVHGNVDREPGTVGAHESNAELIKLWASRPVILAGAFTRDLALKTAENTDRTLVAFGRMYISNPDLPARLKENVPLAPYDRATFYLVGENSPRGYTDPPFAPTIAVAA